MLMVGTLQCRKTAANSADLYNNFVERQRGVLLANLGVLKDHFVREEGIDGWQKASDTFETSMANLYSGSLDDGGYCSSVDSFVRLAASASRPELLLLAKSVADAPVSGVCTAADYSFKKPGGGVSSVPTRRLPPRVALSDALRSSLRADAPVKEAAVKSDAAVVAPLEGLAVTAPERVEVAAPAVQQASVEVVAPPAAPTKDDAVKAAIVALQSAVSALQAASAPAASKSD